MAPQAKHTPHQASEIGGCKNHHAVCQTDHDSRTTPCPTAAKHTPGPWVIVKEERPAIGRTWYDIGVKPDDVFGKICDVDDEPNARLIAAAPDLLEIMREIVDHGYLEESPLIAAARAAIAKAEGR